uniref:Interferon-induced GTP-binding protein Mx3 n=1 Tax=Andrias davidianus TaxID=141262 RepID=A0AA50CJX6_ANDDA|nr:interferon-induced GTP-binding protein Mx3 [Andrias davidianus]
MGKKRPNHFLGNLTDSASGSSSQSSPVQDASNNNTSLEYCLPDTIRDTECSSDPADVSPEESGCLPAEGPTSNQKMDKSLYSQYEEKIRPCIDLIDSLRALGVEKDLGLPAIAVIGDQSSGKSSVLEALSGVTLPRGSGIVTRCPLELKLKKAKRGDEWSGNISYEGYSMELESPSQVEREIIKAQDSLAGGGVGISHNLISLEVSSPDVPDLTLIDLPGIARVAVGDQPKDIGDQIKKLITKFIERQETINLVVVPSNVDIATTEALEMARQVDPSGERTLGILTKPDLVDKGTEKNVIDVVKNNTIPLKKGYMIVKCRGQQEIQQQLSLEEAIQKEAIFFEDHEYFSSLLLEGHATIPVLAERLTTELVEHINKSLPALEQQIKEKLKVAKEELKKCGKGVPDTEAERLSFLVQIIKLFIEDILATSCGEENVSSKGKVRLFTNVRNQFNNWQIELDAGTLQFNSTLNEEVLLFESAHRGRELPGFINYKTFEAIVKIQISELEEPAIGNLKQATHMVQQAFNEIAAQHFHNYRNLYKATRNKIEDMRQKQEEEAEYMIRTQFKMEQLVHSQDKLYCVDLQKISQEVAQTNAESEFHFHVVSLPPINTSQLSIKEMSRYLQAYFMGATSRLANQIPMIIRFYILQEYADKLQNEMLKFLQDKEQYDLLLQENIDLSSKRIRLRERIERLNQAHQHLEKFPV